MTGVCYNVAFDALSKLGRVEEAIELLREMMDKGMVPHVINYTTLIDGYLIRGEFVDALDLVDEMRRNGVSPHVITYNVLAGGFARNGHVKAQCSKPNTQWDHFIQGLCSALKISSRVWKANALKTMPVW